MGNPLNITTQSTIVEGYRKLAVVTHPDKKRGPAKEFLEVNSLYNKISDSASEVLNMKEKEFLAHTQSYITKANTLISGGFLTLKLVSSILEVPSEPTLMSIFEVSKNVMLIASLLNPSSAVLSYGVYSLLTYQFIKDVYNSDIYAATAQLLYNAGSIYLASSTQPSYSKIALGILTTSLTVIGAYDLILLLSYRQLAAANKYAEAQYDLGVLCSKQKDYKCAKDNLQLAADNKHVEAQYALGLLCINKKIINVLKIICN